MLFKLISTIAIAAIPGLVLPKDSIFGFNPAYPFNIYAGNLPNFNIIAV